MAVKKTTAIETKPATKKTTIKKLGSKETPTAPKVQGVTTKIEAHSRVSFKLKENFYTVEFVETREVPQGANLEVERADLWETVHREADKQIQDLLDGENIK